MSRRLSSRREPATVSAGRASGLFAGEMPAGRATSCDTDAGRRRRALPSRTSSPPAVPPQEGAGCCVSERVGQFFFDSGRQPAGVHRVRRRGQPGRAAPRPADAAPDARSRWRGRWPPRGSTWSTLDLLGHGRSDRPADPLVYSMTAFAEQVVALLDHLGPTQAVIGGTSLGANVSLEVADAAPGAGRGPDHRDAGARQRSRGGDPRVRPADVRGPRSRRSRSTGCGC